MRLFAVMLMLITACVVMAADERDDQWNDPALGVALATLDKKPPNIPGLQPFRWPTKRGMELLSNVVDGVCSLGGGWGCFDSVGELNSVDNVGQGFCSIEGSPSLLGGLHELEDHRQAGNAAAASFGPLGA